MEPGTPARVSRSSSPRPGEAALCREHLAADDRRSTGSRSGRPAPYPILVVYAGLAADASSHLPARGFPRPS